MAWRRDGIPGRRRSPRADTRRWASRPRRRLLRRSPQPPPPPAGPLPWRRSVTYSAGSTRSTVTLFSFLSLPQFHIIGKLKREVAGPFICKLSELEFHNLKQLKQNSTDSQWCIYYNSVKFLYKLLHISGYTKREILTNFIANRAHFKTIQSFRYCGFRVA
jgi:hypothetical protein